MASVTNNIRKVRNATGDELSAAQTDLFDRYFPDLRRFASQRLSSVSIGTRDSAAAASDILLSTLRKLSEPNTNPGIAKIDDRNALEGFLINCLKKRIIDHRRKDSTATRGGADKVVVEVAGPDCRDLASAEPTIEDLLLLESLKARLEEATAALRDPLPAVAALLLDGKDNKDVIEVTGIPPRTLTLYKSIIKAAWVNALRPDDDDSKHPVPGTEEAEAYHLMEAVTAETNTDKENLRPTALVSFLSQLPPDVRGRVESIAVNLEMTCKLCKNAAVR